MVAIDEKSGSEVDASSVDESRKKRLMAAGAFTAALVIFMVLGAFLLLYSGVMDGALQESQREDPAVHVASVEAICPDIGLLSAS